MLYPKPCYKEVQVYQMIYSMKLVKKQYTISSEKY